MKNVNESSLKTAALLIELALLVAQGVKAIIGLFRKKEPQAAPKP